MSEPVYTISRNSPLGWLQISGSAAGISKVEFTDNGQENNNPDIPEVLKNCCSQLTEYFEGKRQTFDLKIAPDGTGFQQKVWQQLQQIPFGQTRSYLDIANAFGQPTYTRAVGSANGRNPLAIIVPCHRVIGANGSLTGYAGGLWRKKWLLQFEGVSRQGELF